MTQSFYCVVFNSNDDKDNAPAFITEWQASWYIRKHFPNGAYIFRKEFEADSVLSLLAWPFLWLWAFYKGFENIFTTPKDDNLSTT